jgi:ABC-type bacteriocin/lantibiotic exporter with double-glycine peptidase domain
MWFATHAAALEEREPEPPPSMPASPATSPEFYGGRGTHVCGSNSMYMLLKLYGMPIDQKRFEATVPSGTEGLSLAELQDAAESLGMKATIRRCSIAELQQRFREPFIAHLALVTPHYSVIVAISDDFVTLLDGTTGEVETLRRAWVEERWTGYVLLPQTSAGVPPIFLGASLVSWVLVALLVARHISASWTRASGTQVRLALSSTASSGEA